MKIAIGSDPNATDLKMSIMEFLRRNGYEVTDFGSDDVIYANVAIKVAEEVAAKHFDRGILFCGTGLGVMLAANKVKGAYAAVLSDTYSAQRACLSNNCNIVTIGAQVTGVKKAEVMLKEYLSCTYDPNCRSKEKVERIVQYENEHMK